MEPPQYNEVFYYFKSENSLPLYAPSNGLRSGKQTFLWDLVRSLLVEVLHGGEISKNGEEEVEISLDSVCKVKF